MPVSELPELIVTSKSQSRETIDAILKAQGYNVSNLEEQSDEISPEVPPETPPEPPAVEQPTVEPVEPPAAEPADEEETEEPAAPATPAVATEPKKKGTAQRYKDQRDQARQDAETIRLEKARLEGELEVLRRQQAPPTSTPAPAAATAPAVELAPIPDLKLPDRPILQRPEYTEPDINAAGIDGDFDKWNEARTKATREWQDTVLKLQEQHSEKLYDWKDQVRDLKAQHERAISDRAANQAKSQADTAQAARAAEFNKILEDGKSRYADFEEKSKKDHGKIISSGAMGGVIYEIGLEDKQTAADLIYWISTHPDEAFNLAKLTALPTDTDPKAVNSPADIATAMRKAWVHFNKVTRGLVTEQRSDPGEKPPEEEAPEVEEAVTETAPPAEPPKPIVKAPPAQAPPAAPAAGLKPAALPPVKPAVHTPVGNRSAGAYKKLRDMSSEELKGLHPDEYRKRFEAGEGV